MKELGFLIDRNGNLYPYGKWVEYNKIEKNNRLHFHNTSFEDEVSHLEKFKELGFPYDKDILLALQAREFAKYGMFMILNYTKSQDDGLAFMMYTPNNISVKQNVILRQLYPILSNFDTQYIETAGKIEDTFIEYDSIDEYFEEIGLGHMTHTIKTM